MDFRFDIKPIFRDPISRVTSNMLPHNFRGDRRASIDHATKISEIINTVGEFSAKAQGLSKPVTTAQKLRQSNHTIYLLVDTQDGKNGTVIGMLKIGKKNLYVFDQSGETKMVDRAKCILDFYIHESRQRAGLGKDLFDTMLKHEDWDPTEIAVDRPSDKLLGFLKKHYSLENNVPQMNNFVIYEGFFHKSTPLNGSLNNNHNSQQQMHITNSPNSALFGPIISTASTSSSDNNKYNRGQRPSTSSNVPAINNPIGRYAAGRPSCSMAEGLQDVYDESYLSNQFNQMPAAGKRSGLDVRSSHSSVKSPESKSALQNESMQKQSEQNLNPSEPAIQKSKLDVNQAQQEALDHAKNCEAEIIHQSAMQKSDEPNSEQIENNSFNELNEDEVELVRINFENFQTNENPNESNEEDQESDKQNETNENGDEIGDVKVSANEVEKLRPPKELNFQLRRNKQHTGLKNISDGVGFCVTPTNKMEFYQEKPEDFGVVKINQPVSKKNHLFNNDDNVSVISSTGEGFTDQGYYDLKFYHNKLCDTESLIDQIDIALSIDKHEYEEESEQRDEPDDMIEKDSQSKDFDIHVDINLYEEDKIQAEQDYQVDRPGAGKATVYNESVWETNYPDSDNEIKPTKYRSAKKHAGNKNISSGVSGSFQDTDHYETSSSHNDDISVTVSVNDRTTGKISYDLHQHNKLW